MPLERDPSHTGSTGSPGDSLAGIVRSQWGRILASLTNSLGDLQLAEDSLQDAVESALVHWHRDGVPAVPAAWLIKAARRKAIDRLRRSANFRAKQGDIVRLIELDAADNEETARTMAESTIPDHRLEMIFTCCHPAIEEKSRLALTLRTLGGLTTDEIARAFLDKPDAMAARLTRAKKKIALAGIAYEVPDQPHLARRLQSVLDVIYLIFNEGYYGSREETLLRPELADEAIRLARLVHDLMPEEAEAGGLLALLSLHQARTPARLDWAGQMIPLELQDRGLWNKTEIAQATNLLKRTLSLGRVGPYQLQAAISACHCEAANWPATDWPQIVALYRLLEELTPSTVVTLNRLVAESWTGLTPAMLAELDSLSDELDRYQPYHAARADILRRAGQKAEARLAYERAISLSSNRAERGFLAARLNRLDMH